MKKTLLKNLIYCLLVTLTSYCNFNNAIAASISANFNVSSSISSSCSISIPNYSIGTIVFNTGVNLTTGPNLVYNNFNVLCTNGTSYTVTQTYDNPNPNANYGGYMISPGTSDYLTFGIIYFDKSAVSHVWVTNPLTFTSTGVVDSYPVAVFVRSTAFYSNVTYPTPGNYSGSATLVITY